MAQFSIFSLTDTKYPYIIFVVNIMGIENYCKNSYEFLYFDEIDSTNTYAKSIAKKGAKEGTVVIAKTQTAGKGRLGRTFFSKLDGIYLSVVLRPKFSAENIQFITVAAAVATANAIDEICGVNTGIKWVNDIYLNGKKICGILTETSINTETSTTDYAVLGIGINLSLAGNTLPEDIKNIAGFIFENVTDTELKEGLCAKILDNFFALYKNLTDKEYIDEYRRRSILIGKEVTCSCGEKVYKATVLDIDENARLVVRDLNGEIKFLNAGEVSLKL